MVVGRLRIEAGPTILGGDADFFEEGESVTDPLSDILQEARIDGRIDPRLIIGVRVGDEESAALSSDEYTSIQVDAHRYRVGIAGNWLRAGEIASYRLARYCYLSTCRQLCCVGTRGVDEPSRRDLA